MRKAGAAEGEKEQKAGKNEAGQQQENSKRESQYDVETTGLLCRCWVAFGGFRRGKWQGASGALD